MKIVICASMHFAQEIVDTKNKLENKGHEVEIPKCIDKHIQKEFSVIESTQEKIQEDVIRKYFLKIQDADCVLVLNYEKKRKEGYIGGNTFLEIGFAHVLNKKIFLLNNIPEISYKDEIIAMNPTILNGDLNKIK